MAEPLDQRTIRRYLLDELSSDERESVSARIFEDDAAYDAVREAEDDLLDAAARGELSAEDAAKVRRFARESSQAERLIVARALSRKRGRGVPGPAMVRTFIGIAAAILVVLISTFYVVRLKRPAEVATSQSPLIFTFAAPPGTTRSAQPPLSVRIPPGTQVVRIAVEIEAGFEQYHLLLRTRSGRTVTSENPTKAGRFEIPVPANALTSGAYEVEVTGLRGGQRETLQFHYFNVE
jgi:hypothetical protein